MRSQLLRTATRRPARRGFSLVEVAVAIVIVGVGVLALLQLSAVCSMQNRVASETTTAALLADHIRELLADLPMSDPTTGATTFGAESGETLSTYDDVDDFDGKTFNPVIDGSRSTLSGLDGWSQAISISPVANKNLRGATLAKTTYTGAVRVTINIRRNDPVTHQPVTVFSINSIRVED